MAIIYLENGQLMYKRLNITSADYWESESMDNLSFVSSLSSPILCRVHFQSSSLLS